MNFQYLLKVFYFISFDFIQTRQFSTTISYRLMHNDNHHCCYLSHIFRVKDTKMYPNVCDKCCMCFFLSSFCRFISIFVRSFGHSVHKSSDCRLLNGPRTNTHTQPFANGWMRCCRRWSMLVETKHTVHTRQLDTRFCNSVAHRMWYGLETVPR